MLKPKVNKVNSHNISYFDEGINIDRSPLLLIHGFSFKAGFEPLISHISQNNRVIAPDLPGFGLSICDGFEYSLNNYADFLFEFAQSQGLNKVSLFGNSMGGYLALAAAAKYPDLVDKLIVRSPLFTYKQLSFMYRNKAVLGILKNLAKNERMLNELKKIFFGNFTKLSNKKITDTENFLNADL